MFSRTTRVIRGNYRILREQQLELVALEGNLFARSRQQAAGTNDRLPLHHHLREWRIIGDYSAKTRGP
jgi:hypothetical protein